MRIRDYDYDLPEELIARRPTERRDASRMLVMEPDGSAFGHRVFADLPEYLGPGDLLVLNDTRVFPARLFGRRLPDGGRTEVLLVEREDEACWWALVRPGKRVREGTRIVFEPGILEAIVESYGPQGGGERLLRFSWQGDWWSVLEQLGHTPLPPYIVRARRTDADASGGWSVRPDGQMMEAADRERYQTVYAGEERGSVAAPTAGLHFTPEVLNALERKGVESVRVQLHVGPGTFQPIQTDRVEDHPMHWESIRVGEETARRINETLARGGRVVAVGTTVVRAIETAALPPGERAEIFEPDAEPVASDGPVHAVSGRTRLLIAPGFEYRVTGALLTNFHLPRSSLLLLVSALVGRERVLDAYREAVRKKYRFYSYGDCMLIPRNP